MSWTKSRKQHPSLTLHITVITADQPLFALAKQIQWHWPDEYGNFVVMMGALHIEMAALRMAGRILKGSGWMTAIEESGLASAGTAESFLSVANVTKTRRAHQETVCSLYSLMKAAYEKKDCLLMWDLLN